MNNYVLIAEADRDLASSHAEIFGYEGLTTVIAPDGERAVATLAERGAPDLLLTDVSLPHLDGFELIERLRRTPGGSETAVIVVSASRNLRNKATEVRENFGIDAILATAASHDSMRRIIKRLIEERAPAPAAPPKAGTASEAPTGGARGGEAEMFAADGRATGVRLRETNSRMSAESTRRKRAERTRS